MGASNSPLAASFQPSISHGLKENKSTVSQQRTSMSQAPCSSSTQRHRIHFNSRTGDGQPHEDHAKTKLSRNSSQYQDERKSTRSHSRVPVVSPAALLSEDNLYALSKNQVAHFAPGSRVYPTVSTTRRHLPKPHAGAVERPQTQNLPEKARPLSTSSFTTPALKQHALPRTQHVGETTVPRQTVRIPTKSSSRSTLASSSRQSSTSGEALSPGDAAPSGLYLTKSRSTSSSSSRSLIHTRSAAFINERDNIMKGRRELKTIDEVDSARKQQLRSSVHSQLPTRPPGLDVAAAGSSTKAALRPAPSSASALPSPEHNTQTKRLSQLLGKTSLDGPAGTRDRASSFFQDQRQPTSKFSLVLFLSDPDRLATLLQYLPFEDWYNLLGASHEVRLMVSCNELLREEVFERYLANIGYSRWIWREPEPIMLSLSDLEHYIQSSSIPLRDYARVAEQYLMFQSLPVTEQNQEVNDAFQWLARATRAYNRVVLRLRAQAEMLDSINDDKSSDASCSFSASSSRGSSQCSHHLNSHPSSTASFLSGTSASVPQGTKPSKSNFSSPLYRRGRAALLRVFVPSPQGEWLSDASILECEAELKRASLTHAMRLGDVVWDVALGEEASNIGKMIWDGWYLLDLDYTYSSAGDIPKHIPSLALPPSYFHRIISTGPLHMDPIVRIDVTPWKHEIMRNLQLMQDRLVVGTPQGQLQNAVKWVHRSTFMIRPPPSRPNTLQTKRSASSITSMSGSGAIPITTPNGHHTVHPSWYGAVIIETDGSNESLEDLKERCGLGTFPKKTTSSRKQKDGCEKMVWRILRDKRQVPV
ncbi:hypothetical protein WG66_014419 [Moniliophthora roreri]|nr:hypothetical protein WG66_014419 [Moniliophthora roreri]